MDWKEKGREILLDYGPEVFAALIILVAGYLAAKAVRGLVRRLMVRAKVEETLVSFISNLTYMLLMAFVAIATLQKLGVNTTSFAALVAAAGLAIGLALQGSLGNFASGFLIILLRPLKAGDYVEAAGIAGTVEAINVFATELRTPDNKLIIVPNSAITSNHITNYSAKKTRRVDLVFGIGYGDDIRKAKEILQRILDDDPRILKDPAPVVAVSELADSSVNFVVRPWVARDDYWKVYWDTTEKVKLELDAQGISIPFPQRDVHLHQSVGETGGSQAS